MRPFENWGKAPLLFSLILLITFFQNAFFQVPCAGQQSAVIPRNHFQLGQITGPSVSVEYYEIDSKKPGPTVLVTGGIHGNEPAGFRAAEQIKNWQIQKGRLIVIPEINRLGLAANTRWIPKHRKNKSLRDLNRNFPNKKNPVPRTELAKAVWNFVKKLKPDYAIDLHEGYDFHRINPKSVGSSVITHRFNQQIAKRLVETVNQSVPKEKHFSLLAGNGPVSGSLASACHHFLGSKSFIFETTTKKQDLSKRTRQHRILVAKLLQEIGVTTGRAHRFTGHFTRNQKTIAVFDGPGAGAGKVIKAIEKLKKNQTTGNPRPRSQRPFFIVAIGPKDIRREILNQFDIVIFPGGSASKQAKSIGAAGRKEVKRFVRRGGGYVGICAGAYLASSHYDWSFGFMNASVFNKLVEIPGKGKKSMWYRGGPADVVVRLGSVAQKHSGLNGKETIRYQNGPILSVGNRPDLPKYQTLATFETENGIYAAQKNTMIGAPAIVTSQFGNGRVLAISPHFESTSGKQSALPKLLKLVYPKAPSLLP